MPAFDFHLSETNMLLWLTGLQVNSRREGHGSPESGGAGRQTGRLPCAGNQTLAVSISRQNFITDWWMPVKTDISKSDVWVICDQVLLNTFFWLSCGWMWLDHISSFIFNTLGHSPEKGPKRVLLSWWNKIKIKTWNFLNCCITGVMCLEK